jgi:6-pyruvoyltetrahydropterin/6-carboxytetrahydropterin synthase
MEGKGACVEKVEEGIDGHLASCQRPVSGASLTCMRARLTKDFRFEAAHTLPSLPDGHKCRQMHGHSFKVEISIEGVVDEKIGWVYDHKRISDAMNPLLEMLDHGYLNDIDGLESPTIELLAAWFWRRLEPQLPGLTEIVIYETPTARCSFRGEF